MNQVQVFKNFCAPRANNFGGHVSEGKTEVEAALALLRARVKARDGKNTRG